MKHTLYIYMAAAMMAACASNPDNEARLMLTEARVQMAASQYDEARTTIQTLREKYPRALQTRREALLVLDSLEYLAAVDSLTTATNEADAEEYALRAEFYKKKLQHDNATLNEDRTDQTTVSRDIPSDRTNRR